MHRSIHYLEKTSYTTEFLRKSSKWIGIICLIIIPFFTISQIAAGTYSLAMSTSIMAVTIAVNISLIQFTGRYTTNFILFVTVPSVLFFLIMALQTVGIIAAFWCYPVVICLYMVLPERKAWIANIALLCTTIPIVWGIASPNDTFRFIMTIGLVNLFIAIFIHRMYNQQRELKILAATDTLTGLLNRSLLYQSLEQAVEQSKRENLAMSLISFDIDHFKSINDSYGHAAGDEVLQKLGQLLLKRVRLTDKVFRFGGEEFILLLFETDLEEAVKVAEELRVSIASQQLLSNHPVTVSLGVATLTPNEAWTDWVKRSDENLYIAKSSGRNKVIYQNTLEDFTPSTTIVARMN